MHPMDKAGARNLISNDGSAPAQLLPACSGYQLLVAAYEPE
jgi:hypothetical protein